MHQIAPKSNTFGVLTTTLRGPRRGVHDVGGRWRDAAAAGIQSGEAIRVSRHRTPDEGQADRQSEDQAESEKGEQADFEPRDAVTQELEADGDRIPKAVDAHGREPGSDDHDRESVASVARRPEDGTADERRQDRMQNRGDQRAKTGCRRQ